MARRTIAAEVRTQIVEAVNSGAKPAEVAAKFGVSVPTVYNYLKAANTVLVDTTAQA
jgi:transposase